MRMLERRARRSNRTDRDAFVTHHRAAVEDMPADAFLADYPDAIRAAADELRAVVRRAVPDVVERVRPGWRLIGYEVPVARRARYFAYVAPEPQHVHLGFEYGVWMPDPDGLLEGAHLGLRKVRYVTFVPGQRIPHEALVGLTRDAARIAAMSRGERMSLLLDRDLGSGSTGSGRQLEHSDRRGIGGG